MRALVTGGGGFLGRHVVSQLLQRGDQVRVLGRSDYPDLSKKGVECLRGDIRDSVMLRKAVEGCEEVYHCAALAGIWGPWQDFFEINTLGTKRVIESCIEYGVMRLIYTSSPSVVFDGSSQRNLDESAPYPDVWLTHYPHSKMLGEKTVLEANGTNGLRTVALRPHLIWGPGDTHLIPRLIERARAGQLKQVGKGDNRVDVIHVTNAAKAHLQVAKSLSQSDRCAGKAYFISQDEPVKLWQFINSILDGAGLPPVKQRIPFKVAYHVGYLMEIYYKLLGKREEPRMTRFLACQLAEDHYYSIEAAKRDFDYGPSVSTKAGIKQLFSNDAVGI